MRPDDWGDQLGLDGSSTPVRREREAEAVLPQLALGDLDVSRIVVTESGERLEQTALAPAPPEEEEESA